MAERDHTYDWFWCRIVGHRWSVFVARSSGTQVCLRKRCGAARLYNARPICHWCGRRATGRAWGRMARWPSCGMKRHGKDFAPSVGTSPATTDGGDSNG